MHAHTHNITNSQKSGEIFRFYSDICLCVCHTSVRNIWLCYLSKERRWNRWILSSVVFKPLWIMCTFCTPYDTALSSKTQTYDRMENDRKKKTTSNIIPIRWMLFWAVKRIYMMKNRMRPWWPFTVLQANFNKKAIFFLISYFHFDYWANYAW